MKNGFIYVAIGEAYWKEASASIKSLKMQNSQPVVLVSDNPAGDNTADLFIHIESSGHPKIDKIRSLSKTPFEKTVFLDTDTHVVDDISELFEILERFELAAAHAPSGARAVDTTIPEAFYELNSGVIAYLMTPAVRSFLAEWEGEFTAGVTSPVTAKTQFFSFDQPSFRRQLWRASLSLYVLPPEYNYYIHHSGFARKRVKILHGRHHDIGLVASLLNAGGQTRVMGTFSGATPTSYPLGYVSHIGLHGVAGWCDEILSGQPANIDILINGALMATVQADLCWDEATSNRGRRECHGFSYQFPEALSPQQSWTVEVRARGTTASLPNGHWFWKRPALGNS